MKGKLGSSAFLGLLFVISFATPPAFADSGVVHPLQAAASTSSSQGVCFGYNGVDDSFIPRTVSSLRIALVQPILTSTPYSQYNTGSFYGFYYKEQGVNANVTDNLNLLNTNVSSGSGFNGGWGLSFGMYRFFTSQLAKNCGLLVGKNVQILTDMNVSQGALFYTKNQTARFDVVVLPFSEYVIAEEYLAYEDFVAGGGTLVMMGHSLEYPVKYNATTNFESLVYGHGWAFNGKYAYPIACNSNTYVYSCPWAKNNTDWMGSNTCMASCFHTYKFNGSLVNTGSAIGRALANEFGGKVFKSYASHEENTVTNMTGTSIVSVFANDSKNLIAAHTHQFRKGLVVCMGVFGDDIIATDQSAQYFLLLGMVSSRLGPASIPAGTTTTSAATSHATSPAGVTTTTTTISKPDQTASATAAPPSTGTLASVVIVVAGGLAVAVLAGAVVLRRRRTASGA